MAEKIIVVIGATGAQGSSVARTFLREPGWRVRGVTRDPSKVSSTWLRDAGAELVAGDLDSPASLDRAFAGASAVFGVTDFWQFMQDPEAQKEAATRQVPLNIVAYEREIVQGKNMVDAAAKQLGSLERFVWSTLSDTKKWSGGTITRNYHFDGKAAVTDYVKTTYPELAARTSYLQVGMYMSNWEKFGGLFLAPQKQTDGTHLMRYIAKDIGTKLPWVYPPQDTGPFVRALVIAAPPGKTVVCTSNLLTLSEWAELWGRLHGKTCRYAEMPAEELKGIMPPFVYDEISDSARYVSKYGWDGGDPEAVSAQDIGVRMEELVKAEDYVRQANWSQFM